ncbi:hypothetical protein ACIQ6Y_15220 [Streptomyces sp. NPDC096205]|uniref:hypothetical protein n=1 Tax=Streptomyces sp. NPDC096205 TaxID=3366081 RepID=UPI0038309746
MSLRVTALRTALETALGEPVAVQSTTAGVRLSAPAPDPADPVWACVLTVLGQADVWGSSDTAERPEIWAQLVDR